MTNKVVITNIVFGLLMLLLIFSDSAAEEIELSCAVMDKFYILWSESWFGEDPTREKCAWIIRDEQGRIEWKRWPASREWKKEIWKGAIPRNVIAQVHTHPLKTDPRPSTRDQEFSQTLNVPLYTVSRKGIWKATPDGKITKIADTNWQVVLYKDRCKSNTRMNDLSLNIFPHDHFDTMHFRFKSTVGFNSEQQIPDSKGSLPLSFEVDGRLWTTVIKNFSESPDD